MRFQAACAATCGFMGSDEWRRATQKNARDAGEGVLRFAASSIIAYADALLKELDIKEPKE